MGEGDKGIGKQHKIFQTRFYINATFTWSRLNYGKPLLPKALQLSGNQVVSSQVHAYISVALVIKYFLYKYLTRDPL